MNRKPGMQTNPITVQLKDAADILKLPKAFNILSQDEENIQKSLFMLCSPFAIEFENV